MIHCASLYMAYEYIWRNIVWSIYICKYTRTLVSLAAWWNLHLVRARGGSYRSEVAIVTNIPAVPVVLYAFLLKFLGLSWSVDWKLHKTVERCRECIVLCAQYMFVTWCYTMLHHVNGVVIFNNTRPRSCTGFPVPSCCQALLWRDFLEHRTFNAAFHAVVVPCPARGDSMLFHELTWS